MPALLLAMLAFSMIQTSVVPILPSLAREFDVTGAEIAWLVTANLLSAAVLTPVLGRVGDTRGRKPVLLVALGGLVAGSALAVATHSLPLLILARVLQGTAGGVLPLAIGVVRDAVPGARAAGGVALISAALGVGSGLGLVLTGLLLQLWSYESIFWVGLALGLLAVAAVIALVPSDPPRDRTGGADPVGAVLLAAWLSSLLIAISQGNGWGWTSAPTVGLFVAAVLLAGVWVAVERRVAHPLVDLAMMSRPGVAVSNAAGVLIGFGMYGSFMVISNFVQTPAPVGYGFGASVLSAGLLLLPSAAGSLIAAPVGAAVLARRGPRTPLVLGGVLASLSMTYLFLQHAREADVLAASAVFGLGVGLAFAAMPAFINSEVPPAHSGSANGINAVLRTVGGATGTAVLSAVLTNDTIPGVGLPGADAYRLTFLITAAACLVAAAVPVVLRLTTPSRPRAGSAGAPKTVSSAPNPPGRSQPPTPVGAGDHPAPPH
ncbi:MFS transporter [Streptomyces sp. NPDC057445]|uniref:MFS transporter n=1 Tax=Streptomyces sp. NPDC057445 TaxID=3346136 RepID=UPI0036914D8D